MERSRNLNFDEIYDQVVMIKQQVEKTYDQNLSNIVFMGMGEPLLNYKNVLKAIEKITSPEGLGMSPRRITVSTAGVAKQIKQLGDDQVKFKLALSLHAANDKKRNEIMQMAILEPEIAILDETDSGLDIDALRIVAKGIREVRADRDKLGILLITHYQRLLDELQPDFVHIMIDGRIVASGGMELAEELEKSGYEAYR